MVYWVTGLEFGLHVCSLLPVVHTWAVWDVFEMAADWFPSGNGFLGEMDYKAAWNVRFPGVIVFVEKHFLVSLGDLSLDILHSTPDSSVVFI